MVMLTNSNETCLLDFDNILILYNIRYWYVKSATLFLFYCKWAFTDAFRSDTIFFVIRTLKTIHLFQFMLD